MTESAASPVAEEKVRWASYSALAQHRTCPQKYNYARIRRLERLPYNDGEGSDIPVERDFGSWWHMLRAADALARGRQHDSLKWVPEELTCVDNGPTLKAHLVSPRDVIDLAIAWWDKQSLYVEQAWIERIGEGLPARLVALYESWKEQWADEIAAERPLAVELKWTRRLPVPQGYDPVELIGYVDEIYLDTRRNIVVARDDKSVKKLGSQTAADDMMDSQLQFYSWGAAPIVKTWGLAIQATAYDRTRMTKPSTPVLTGTGTLSKSKGTDTDLATYLAFCKGPDGNGVPWGEEGCYFASGPRKDLPKFGLYTAEDSVIERLSSPATRSTWFQRTTVPLNRNLVKAHLLAGVESAMDVQRTRKRVEQTKAAGRNLGSACRWCDFQKLCRAEMWGGVDGTYDLTDMNLKEKGKK